MKTLCLLAITLLCVSAAIAEETFFSALESKAEVEKEGGTVDGGSFKPGKFGNGFVSEAVAMLSISLWMIGSLTSMKAPLSCG